ncbi:unnamed protein product [Protopolystoma xenopodis]|uniref:Uncharacterized protein n=1 Tax=Protopolystoma xenopodis TaxID=117903 RepID=A0A3S5ACK3_9PLAT|nr:unnamed protein product [Protopolystoma xenopodis]
MLQTTPPPPLPQQSSQTPGHPYTQYTHSNTHHSQSQQQQQQLQPPSVTMAFTNAAHTHSHFHSAGLGLPIPTTLGSCIPGLHLTGLPCQPSLAQPATTGSTHRTTGMSTSRPSTASEKARVRSKL